MAKCGGCQNRANAGGRAFEATKRGNVGEVARMGAYIVKTGARDLSRLTKLSLSKTMRKR